MLIYIIEDDENIREIEGYALKNSGYEVGLFGHIEEFHLAMEKQIPDLLILDIMLPKTDGLTILKQLRKDPRTEHMPIIMVTAKSSELDKVKGLDMGADDYVTKPFGVMELISRVKALLRRSASHDKKEEICYKAIAMNVEKHLVMVNDMPCELTYKEFALLQYLLENVNLVLSRERIMERVWGFDYEGETRTVDVHINTLRQKLGDGGNLIKTVRNVGYKLSE